LLLLLRRDATSLRRLARPAIILTAFAVFMSLPLSRPIWNVFPQLQETQFPWRWLILVSMGTSIVAAAALPLLTSVSSSFDRVKRIVILGAMTISIAFTLSHIVREAKYLSPRKFVNTLAEVRGTASVNYWVPIWARSNPRPMSSAVEANRPVDITSWEPQHRQFSVGAGAAAEVRVKTFYYPHWTATSDGQMLATRPDADGALLINVPDSATNVDLEFREPSRTRVSFLVSCAGLLFISGLAIPRNWRR
jgi:hypothetical protein